jgi:hypothetical protein
LGRLNATEGCQITAADSFDLSSNAYRMLRASQLLNVADLLELVSSKGLIVIMFTNAIAHLLCNTDAI